MDVGIPLNCMGANFELVTYIVRIVFLVLNFESFGLRDRRESQVVVLFDN
jgi:hypothetical protein